MFYFYDPFGQSIFEQVTQKIRDSQTERNRNIWSAYYHPVFGELFEKAGFVLKNEVHNKIRDTITQFYCYPKME